ncbi:MAG TPA: hypothetical protein VG944_05675 [Fimbriimonas sp.]|nr:hypothetical protein [Fimbriimonas sp.]
MKLLRLTLSIVATVLLTGGYLASQAAALQGPQEALDYAKNVDAAPIRYLALFLLVAAIALAFVPAREEEP